MAAGLCRATPPAIQQQSVWRVWHVTFLVSRKLAEGRQELVAVARDRAGNESTAKVVVIVDTTPPALNAQVRPVVKGTVEPGSSVLINGAEIPVDGSGHYKKEVPVRKRPAKR